LRARGRAGLVEQPRGTLGGMEGVGTEAAPDGRGRRLGRAVGNAMEGEEEVAYLAGQGPPDLVEVVLALAREMLALAGIEADPAAALADGSALTRYREMIAAQGGDPDAALPVAPHTRTVAAPATGFLVLLGARGVGGAARRVGAGRARKEHPASPSAGVLCLAKPGDWVEEEQPLLEVRADEESRFDAALATLGNAIEIGQEGPDEVAPVIDRITVG